MANNEWSTPQLFFDELQRSLNRDSVNENDKIRFTVDVAANDGNRKCETFLERDGHVADWPLSSTGISLAWCNPPYSRGSIQPFVENAIRQRDRISTVMLLPYWTDRDWFSLAIRSGAYVTFLGGRVAFIDPTNAGRRSPSFGVILLGITDEPAKDQIITTHVSSPSMHEGFVKRLHKINKSKGGDL